MIYQPTYGANDLIFGEGCSIIVTGWTRTNIVAKKLAERNKSYAALGNLYSNSQGVTILAVNLLACEYSLPVHILYCTKQDYVAKSTLALYSLFKGDFRQGPDSWELLSKENIIGHVNQLFLEEDLKELSNPYFLWRDLNDFLDNYRDAKLSCIQHQEPKVYHIPKALSELKPGPSVGIVVKADKIATAWVDCLYRIRNQGKTIGNRQEILNLVSVIAKEPEYLDIPNWVPTTRNQVEQYLDDVLTGDTASGVSYTYGSRLRKTLQKNEDEYIDQIEETAQKLALVKDTTRAVMTTWNPTLDLYSEQPPCLNHIFVRIVDDELTLTATFRSHDIYYAYCSNLYALRAMQDLLCARIHEINPKLRLTAGQMTCISQSAHIYDWSFEAVDIALENHRITGEIYSDDVGDFLIEVVDGKVQLNQIDSKGQVARIYRVKPSEQTLLVCRRIASDNPDIKPTHLAYLALEVGRAQQCAQSGEKYRQDYK